MLTIAVCDDNPRFAHQLAAKVYYVEGKVCKTHDT